MAFEKENVRGIRSLVVDQVVGTADKNYLIVEVTGESDNVANTYDVSTDIPSVQAIAGLLLQEVNGATAATANTYSGTTVTFASHTGAGAQRVWLICEV